MPKRVKIGEEEAEVLLREDLDKIVESVDAGFRSVQSQLDKLGTETPPRSQITEAHNNPIYKCTGKDCQYATDDLSDFVTHVVKENMPKTTPIERVWGEEVPKRHETVKDYLDCPECYPKFEKAMLENPKFKAKLEEIQKAKAKEKKGGLDI